MIDSGEGKIVCAKGVIQYLLSILVTDYVLTHYVETAECAIDYGNKE